MSYATLCHYVTVYKSVDKQEAFKLLTVKVTYSITDDGEECSHEENSELSQTTGGKCVMVHIRAIL